MILGIVGAAAAAPSRLAQTATSPAAQVRTAERTLLRAAVDADTQTAGALLTPDFQLIDVTGAPETRADYLGTIAAKIFVKLEPISPISVRVHGSSAVARVKLHFKVEAGGLKLEHDGWTTDVFEQRQGRWQVVWSQSTAIPNDEALFAKSLEPRS
jgi:ketosteroid isomerase-like protein